MTAQQKREEARRGRQQPESRQQRREGGLAQPKKRGAQAMLLESRFGQNEGGLGGGRQREDTNMLIWGTSKISSTGSAIPGVMLENTASYSKSLCCLHIVLLQTFSQIGYCQTKPFVTGE